MSKDAERVAREFLGAMATREGLLGSIQTYCAPECSWANTGLPTAENRDAMVATMQSFIDGFELDRMVVEFVAIAANGNTVLTERIDHLEKADGSTIASLPVSGTLEVSNGKIVRWSDYFDPRPFLPG
jgi:limonene-1,2-epoxide hydrolase